MIEKILRSRLFVLASLFWTASLGVSLAWNLHNSESQVMEMAYAEARANLNKDITLRRWGTLHGGVYVPITDTQKSVPWLSHVPGRDVTTTDGRKLTLLNPASMLRQMMDLYAIDYGIRGRITGLRYLNPGNAPDDWERTQLDVFSRGERKEVWEIARIDGKPYLRYLRAMYMEPGCDKCHAILGYKTGDLRGATGLNLPLAPYLAQIAEARVYLGASHLALWLVGLTGIVWAAWSLALRAQERDRNRSELVQHQQHLESLVAARTAELSESMRAAEAASRAKSTFLANMSHEIRTPLNAITGMAHLMQRAGVSAKQAEQLAKIDAAGRHLLDIINAVLDLSKIEAGKFVLEETGVSIEALLCNVSAMLEERAQGKGLRLVRVHDAFPPGLLGDPTRLQQALLNYVTNAVKFTAAGTVTLRALLVAEDDDSVLVRFEVEDTGIGIPEAKIGRLFADFEQGDSSTTRQYGGTGLGLAITRRIAEATGGEAGVVSSEGVGSTFWFTARLKKGAARGPVEAAAPASVAAEDILAHEYRGLRVLLVEDELVNQEIAQMLLADIGANVDVAADGAQAVALAERKTYQMILMDLQMPELDGIEAGRIIRARGPNAHTPILALTANAFDEDRQHCLAAGMNDFVAKPIDPDTFFSVLLRNLRGPGDDGSGGSEASPIP